MSTTHGADATAVAALRVRNETISNTVATAVIAILLTWALFRGASGITALDGPPGGIFGILPGTFNFTLLVTLALTLIVRRRVDRAAWSRVSPAEGNSGLGDRLPRNVLLRALILALSVSAVLVPLTYLLVWASIRWGWVPSEWSFVGIVGFFVCYFVGLSLIVTPIVVRRALRD